MKAELRRAALCLHTVSDEDRRWLLERLPRRVRPILINLLRELQAMGIPAQDPAWSPVSREEFMADGLPATAWPHLMDTPPQRVAMVLGDKDLFIVAALSACTLGAWRDAFLEALPVAMRRIISAGCSLRLGPRGEEFLAQLVLERLNSAPVKTFVLRRRWPWSR